MKAQTQWAQKVYGNQSDRIQAYTELHLIERNGRTRGWSSAAGWTHTAIVPLQDAKLLLLGTNDRSGSWTPCVIIGMDSPSPSWSFKPRTLATISPADAKPRRSLRLRPDVGRPANRPRMTGNSRGREQRHYPCRRAESARQAFRRVPLPPPVPPIFQSPVVSSANCRPTPHQRRRAHRTPENRLPCLPHRSRADLPPPPGYKLSTEARVTRMEPPGLTALDHASSRVLADAGAGQSSEPETDFSRRESRALVGLSRGPLHCGSSQLAT